MEKEKAEKLKKKIKEMKVCAVARLDDEELQELYGTLYGKRIISPKDRTKWITKGTVVLTIDEAGEIMLPETRDIKCGCGRNMKVWLVQELPPIWVGRCPRCKGLHVKGERNAVGKLTKKDIKVLLKKAKLKRKRSNLK